MMRVSVVVPAFNEEWLLPDCLAALQSQDYAGEVEIIVVDNGSTDATAEVARRYGVRLISEPVTGYCRALACGFGCATGQIIASTDADSRVPSNWISRLVREYESNPEVVAVGGAIAFGEANWKAALLTRGLLPLINRIDRGNARGPHLWGANFSVLRRAFLQAGGWNPGFELQADTELSERMRKQGRVVLLEDLEVWSSSRRWNQALIWNMYLFASNFAWFKLTGRALYHGFPTIRVAAPSLAPPRRQQRLKSALTMAGLVVLLLVVVAGYLAVTPESNAFGQTYWHATTHRKQVALTFDDGPNEPYTSEVVRILAQEHVRATFFMIGTNVRHYPKAAALVARMGHVIGNHTDTHPDAFALEPVSAVRAELSAAEESIHAATGLYPRFFRPPHGIRSPWLISALTGDSLVTVTWDDAPRDWDPRPAHDLIQSTLAQVHPGSIILLHDGMNLEHGADRTETIRALPAIIRGLRERGYEFRTVPELLNQPPYMSTWTVPGSRTMPDGDAAMRPSRSNRAWASVARAVW